jgi:predicted MFS family arabinose efflux permease
LLSRWRAVCLNIGCLNRSRGTEHPHGMTRPVSERTIIFLIGAVQFVNILDFVMVMPLGPDFVTALQIDPAQVGYIAGAYTAAAAISGLIGALFLDLFDRRKALGLAMLGLVLGTASGGFAWNLHSLMAARVLAGMFGGPATSLAFSIVADVIPTERRGKAMAAVMGAFSVAQVIGVPAGLRLARLGGWNLPFFAVAGLGFVVVILSIFCLPPMTKHMEGQTHRRRSLMGMIRQPRILRERVSEAREDFAKLLDRPIVLMSYAMTATTMMSGFVLIPSISTYVQFNLGFPREHLDLCYAIAGATTIFTIRLVGTLVDRFGSFRIGSLGATMLAGVVYGGFVAARPPLPMVAVIGIFVAFMTAMSFRNVAYNTLTSKVPRPVERARFTSLQSTVQHVASTLGAFLSSLLLTTLPSKELVGMSRVATVTIGLSALVPFLLWRVESMLATRTAEDLRSPLPQRRPEAIEPVPTDGPYPAPAAGE